MTQQDFIDAFILWLSGAAKMKNEKEIWWEDADQEKITIEFPIGEVDYAIVRGYIGAYTWETEYRNYKRNGFSKSYYSDGKLAAEYKFKDGFLVF